MVLPFAAVAVGDALRPCLEAGASEPLRLSRHSAALRLLQYVRDEAHRFAQHYLHLLRRKKLRED